MKSVLSTICFLAITCAVTHLATAQRKPLLAIPEVDRADVICFALYTVHDGTLKLTAQLYPLQEGESREARLEAQVGGLWKTVASTKVIEDGWTAPFRVEKWDNSKDIPYRVRHGKDAMFEGTIKADPVNKNEVVVMAFTGNSINPAHGGDISREDILANARRIKPDLLFFSGDQVYDHHKHYAAWLKFGRDFGDIIKDIPTITIPDDHDVGQPNLWGESGKKSKGGGAADGGYIMPVPYVKQVERAQTSHLPDPVDPRPIGRGIGVYFTDITVGGVSFAIIEDRKFKTGPDGKIPKQGPRPDHIRDPAYNPADVDVEGLVLLGDRQLNFLNAWGQDWHDCEMKAVLSQTIFCGGAHIHGKLGGRLHADMDSNGWPQTGRNKAIAELRRCFAVHIAGDQHLGSIFHHGIDEFGDGGYSFCVPSIANLYLRFWDPLEKAKPPREGMPAYTGNHLDGFANKVTCWAAANPVMKAEDLKAGPKLSTRAAGFGVIRFDKPKREITFECWPRNVDITKPETRQYEGWPLTVKQEDNYGRQAVAWLPTLEVAGIDEPVIQVVNEKDGEVIYTLRANSNTWQPKVFADGSYTVIVSDGGENKVTKNGLKAGKKDAVGTLQVELK